MARKKKSETINLQQSKSILLDSANIILEDDKGNKSSLSYYNLMDELKKSITKNPVNTDIENKVDKNKVLINTQQVTLQNSGQNAVKVKGIQRLTDDQLKTISLYDPYISAIISTRCNQVAPLGKISTNKFDRGIRINDLNTLSEKDFNNKSEYEYYQKTKTDQTKFIQKFILNCGTTDDEVLNEIFRYSDKTFKKCKLHVFLSCQARNLLTFGRCATHITRDEDGNILTFRPVPVESIYLIDPNSDFKIHINPDTLNKKQYEQTLKDVEEYNNIPKEERPQAYIQRIDGHDVAFFTEHDLVIWDYQKQSFIDLYGYNLAPIEQCIYFVFVHQNTLQYLSDQFLKGVASKMMLNLETTNPQFQLSQEDISALKEDIHNCAVSNHNSSVIPIIAGPVKVTPIPLNGTTKDMEFLQVENSIIRSICSSFQIDPSEVGLYNLGGGEGGLSNASKENEIVNSQERGLRILLDILFDGLSELVYDLVPEFRDQYEISYSGIGNETFDAILQRSTTEIMSTATMNSLLIDSDKKDLLEFGGDVPMSPHWHANVAKYMKMSEMRYFFFKETDALNNPDYDFWIDPAINNIYLQNKQLQQQAMVQPSTSSHSQQETTNEQPTQSNISTNDNEELTDIIKNILSKPQENNTTNDLFDKIKNILAANQDTKQTSQKSINLSDTIQEILSKSEEVGYFDIWKNLQKE